MTTDITMTTDYQLYTKIIALPSRLKQEVAEFAEFLQYKEKTKGKLKECLALPKA